MGKPETIQEYLTAIEEQIRWKRARPVVALELQRHLEDQRDAFLEEGSTPKDAERLAVEEMGDPVSVGAELDHIHRPKPQWGLLGLTVLLAIIGSVLRVWLTARWTISSIDPVRTLAALLVGTACLLAGYFLDYAVLGRHAVAVYVGAVIAGVLALWLSPEVNNASYYTRYVVLCYPVVYAIWLYFCRQKHWKGVLLAMAGGVPLALICLAAPSTTGLLLLLLVGFALLLVAGWDDWFEIGRRKSMAVPLVCAGAMIGTACYGIFFRGYLQNRWTMLVHPELDPYGAGYQAMSVRRALSIARRWGEGQWNDVVSPYSYDYTVPGCEGDFFLTTIIYKLGWLPFLMLVLAVAFLLLWLLHRCLRQRNPFGRLVALSVVLALGLQGVFSIFLNMGFVLTSVHMPFLVGNLHMVLDMGLIGMALSVFRESSIVREASFEKFQHRYT